MSWVLWHSKEASPNYFAHHLGLSRYIPHELPPSDASNPKLFHRVPTHIKRILYLDCPDVILEWQDVPVLAIEISREAGTGHNAFQRFGRVVAAVENRVPTMYVYPEAVWIQRKNAQRWDRINPLIFESLECIMRTHSTPALLFYYPTHFNRRHPQQPPPVGSPKGHIDEPALADHPLARDPEIQAMFDICKRIIQAVGASGTGAIAGFIHDPAVQARRTWMQGQLASYGGPGKMHSPLTSCEVVPTVTVMKYLRRFAPKHAFDLLPKREKTVIYGVDSATIRGDPYAGALSAIDYLRCRSGPTYEDRHTNLAMAWGRLNVDGEGISIQGARGTSVDAFTGPIRELYRNSNKVLLGKKFGELSPEEIPRYYMQVRFGTTFTKPKHIRMLAYLCDAILFHDGALWRDA
jgi:hypothetical protein